jgi:hypothetical protein
MVQRYAHIGLDSEFLMKVVAAFCILSVLSLCASVTHAQSSPDSLAQYVRQLQQNPTDDALREKIIKQALTEKPAIPEEARRAFVQGSTISKAANDAKQQTLAIESFSEAVKLAPWWGDAYYNLAVAQELAGRFSDARASLKFFLLTQPDGQLARKTQDHIYELEAKEKLAKADASSKADKAAADKAAEETAKRAETDARWNARWKGSTYISSQGAAGYPFELTSKKNGNVIEFINPVMAEQTRVQLRGAMSESGSISWELNRWPCGMHPVNVSVSADYKTLQYSASTIDISSCNFFRDVNTTTLTRQ